ncbi:sensor histidine kinase [Streptomyces sp. NPDC018031]|uniref:sensor histidine kinase n=1 Tax=Streptomyces sp. NPDC018031 TaxID=3365033 RepID=UPI00379B43D5
MTATGTAATGFRGRLRAVPGARARLRWVHLILGGALLMPYYLLTSVLCDMLIPHDRPLDSLAAQLAAYATALPLAALTGFFPLVRPLSVTAVRALCRPPGPDALADGAATSWDARSRTSLWYTLHLALGGLVSAVTLAVPPAALCLVALPAVGAPGGLDWLTWPGQRYTALAPVTGLVALASVVALAAGAGALLARCAPPLLGPVPADRLAAAEARAAALAARDRLARELHDSVGHALSAVTLQAAAARKLLDDDPGFARQALAAIEETTRSAVGELDGVLGLLREDRAGTAAAGPAPTLADLPALLARTRAAGCRVTLAVEPADLVDPFHRLPPVVSREAYRIVQEGLGNALRHAGRVPVRLRIAVPGGGAPGEELEIEMENPVRGTARWRRTGGGRGLRGVAERTALLRGRCEWGAGGGVWRLSVRLPPAGAGAREEDR